jgi:site-specific recombinase XerD
LRHRAGTTVYQRTGHDLRLTQVFLGHSDPSTTAIYVHVNDDDLRAASEAARIAA